MRLPAFALPFLAVLFLTPSLAADPVPLADFFRNPVYTSAVMSPAGKHVAVTVRAGKNNRQGLIVMDVEDLAKSKALAGYVDADVILVRWVNENRIVFSVTDRLSPLTEQIGSGLFVADREGKEEPHLLIKRQNCGTLCGSTSALSVGHWLRSVLRDGTDDVIVGRYEAHGTSLVRLDTITGRTTSLTFGAPESVWSWALDPKGEPRVAYTNFEGTAKLFWKATPQAEWKKVWEQPAYASSRRDTVEPIAVDASNIFYVGQYLGDEDTRSLAKIDMSQASNEPQPLLALKGYDFHGSLVYGPKGEVIGIRYLTDASGTHWFDERLKAIQAKVDAKLPGFVNEIDCGQCADPRVVLVRSWSDRQPVVFQLYDAKADKFTLLGQSRPWIKPETMARREMDRVKARDGLEFPVHVTRPKGQSAPAPTVVLVHGGPNVRGGTWQWDAQSQFLASRGYVVVEPEYRGSTGFGSKLFAAGLKQWGLAMQDDIADATKWAVDKGYADPKRICIAGASYGGYATLMGLARYPDLYRCGVEWVGVADIDLMFTSRWSMASSIAAGYPMRVLVGEPGSKQLVETSPINLAAKITQPLLMAYGGEDYRVPIQHGARMRSALEPYNKNVEWIEYREEGHGWILESNNVDFWTRVEKFLVRNLRDK